MVQLVNQNLNKNLYLLIHYCCRLKLQTKYFLHYYNVILLLITFFISWSHGHFRWIKIYLYSIPGPREHTCKILWKSTYAFRFV